MAALSILLDLSVSLFCSALVLRCLAQWCGADFRNPICQALIQITSPLLVPLQKVVPGWKGRDISPLVLLVTLVFIEVCLLLLLRQMLTISSLLWTTLYKCTDIILDTCFFTILLQVISSWVNPNPHHPVNLFLNTITGPILAPIRRRIPPLGGIIDFSAMITFILLYAVNVQITAWLFPYSQFPFI